MKKQKVQWCSKIEVLCLNKESNASCNVFRIRISLLVRLQNALQAICGRSKDHNHKYDVISIINCVGNCPASKTALFGNGILKVLDKVVEACGPLHSNPHSERQFHVSLTGTQVHASLQHQKTLESSD